MAETRFRHAEFDWDARPASQNDIFGLGSLVYFIMTGAYPYADRPSDEVEKLYLDRHFPADLASLTCGPIIHRCWARNVSAEEVYDRMATLERNHVY